jgi:hypothetical protein
LNYGDDASSIVCGIRPEEGNIGDSKLLEFVGALTPTLSPSPFDLKRLADAIR